MTSDIFFDDSGVRILGDSISLEGGALVCQATDLILDHSEFRRRGSDPNTPRRAMAHDPKDGLTFNKGSSYPGGVMIDGEVKMSHRLVVRDTILVGRKAFAAPVASDSGVVSTESALAGGDLTRTTDTSVITGSSASPPDAETFEMVDLLGEVLALRAAVASLQTQIDALKK